MVAPLSTTPFCSSMMHMTGWGVRGSNSVLLAPSRPRTSLENSMVATWNPRHTPRNGTPCSLAYLAAAILPSTPRTPKPPGTMTPWASPRISSGLPDTRSSLSTNLMRTLHSIAAPAWTNASRWERYESAREVYFPTSATVTSLFGLTTRLTNASQPAMFLAVVRGLSFILSMMKSATPWLSRVMGTS